MQTPNNKIRELTEKIMRIFWHEESGIRLDTSIYNRVWSHVKHVLETESGSQPSEETRASRVISNETFEGIEEFHTQANKDSSSLSPQGESGGHGQFPGELNVVTAAKQYRQNSTSPGNQSLAAPGVAPAQAQPDVLNAIIEWLEEHSLEVMKSAMARRDSAKTRGLTAKELKDGKRLAEKMSGQKLTHVSATVSENKAYCDMQDGIAEKLETEARQLSTWADVLRASDAQKGQGWVSVEERLPNDHDLVLVFRESGTVSVGWHHLTAKRWYNGHTAADGNFKEQFVTHWQPLPAPPPAPAGTQEEKK